VGSQAEHISCLSNVCSLFSQRFKYEDGRTRQRDGGNRIDSSTERPFSLVGKPPTSRIDISSRDTDRTIDLLVEATQAPVNRLQQPVADADNRSQKTNASAPPVSNTISSRAIRTAARVGSRHAFHGLFSPLSKHGVTSQPSRKEQPPVRFSKQRDANSLEECQLIDDVGETPTTALRGTWGALPAAVRITSERGSQLLSVALKHTDCADGDGREEAEQSLPRLYDERGTGILNEEQVEPEADPGDSDRWLVPILGAERKSADDHTTERKILGQTTERIHCRCCEETTEHRFSGYEQLPEETRDGSPIWHCHDCGTPRFGPAPE